MKEITNLLVPPPNLIIKFRTKGPFPKQKIKKALNFKQQRVTKKKRKRDVKEKKLLSISEAANITLVTDIIQARRKREK